MSVRDDIRASRHAQGQAAKERVLSGQYLQPKQESASEGQSIRDRIRARSLEAPPLPVLPSAASMLRGYQPPADPAVQPDYLKPQAPIGSPAALQQFKQTAPPPSNTPRADWLAGEQAKRDANAPQGGIGGFLYKNVLNPFVSSIDQFQANIPGISDFQRGAGNAMGIEADTAPARGGALGKVANIAGNVAGFVVNPAQIEQNLLTAPYKAASAITQGARATRALGAADNALARGANAINPALNRVGVNIGPRATQGAAQRFTEGAIAGGIQGAANSGVRGETDVQDVARNAAFGAALGGAGDALLGGLGAFRRPAAAPPGPPGPRTAESPFGPQPMQGPNPLQGPEQAIRGPLQATQPPRVMTSPLRRDNVLNAAPEPAARPLITTEGSGQGIVASPFGRAKAYDNPAADTKSQLVTRQDKERLPLGANADRVYTNLVDDLHPIRVFDKEVEKVTGKKLDTADSAHTLALGSRGADVISKDILTSKLVDIDGNVVGNSLKDILNQLPKKKNSYVDFEDYLVNRHAITRGERGEKVFSDDLKWTPEFGAQKLAQYDAAYPQFAKMADEVYEFQNNMAQKWLVDTGMIPQEALDAWVAANPTYVPNKRFFSKMEKGSGGKSRPAGGLAGQSSPVKGYNKGGSQRKIISPIEAMIENVDGFVKAAKRNQSMQAVARNLEENPEALEGFAQIVDESQAMTQQSLGDINKVLSEDGIDGLVSQLTNDFDASYRKAIQTGPDKDNVVRVMVDGKPVYVKMNDPAMLEAVTAMGPENVGAVMRTLGKVTQVFKTLTTGANPVFSLTRNLWRDIPQAYVASKSTNNPVEFVGDLLQAAYNIGFNKELYQEFKRVGGGHSSSVAADRNLLAQAKRDVLPQRDKIKGAVPRAYGKLLDAMNAVESAPRLAEFKRITKAGGNSPESKRQGLAAAQDVTVNFKRRGKVTKDFDRVLPYVNAAAQGLDKFGRMFKDAPVKTPVKAALALSIPAMVAYALNYDNPDYAKVSRQIRDNYILIPNPADPGKFFKIAKPKELGTVFTDIPERLMDMFLKQDPDAFAGFANQLRTNFLPPGVAGFFKSGGLTDRAASGLLGDTILGPFANAYANRDFADHPIVPAALQNLSPALQSDPKTSTLAKWIGEHTKTSPKKLDYILKQYSGIIGQLGQPALSPGGTIGQTLTQQVTVDPVFSNDISNKMYRSKDKLDQARTDYNTTGELPDDYNDGLRKYLGKVTGAMSDIRKQMRLIEADKTIPGADKRKQLRDLQEQINQLAGQGNEAVQTTKQ